MKLYKFQPDNDLSIENLQNNQIWFSNQSDLNDPSEGKIPFNFYEPEESEWTEIHEIARINRFHDFDNIKIIEKSLPSEEQRRFIKNVAKTKVFNAKTNSGFSISCFSTNLSNYLLWCHYADGQRGFCLEFDNNYEPFKSACKIKYDGKPITLSIKKTLTNKIEFKKLVGSKLPIWDYEKEFRILELKSAHIKKYSIEALTGIYLGSKMTWERRKELFVFLKDLFPKTKIFGMSFETELEGFSFGELFMKENTFGFIHTNFQKC